MVLTVMLEGISKTATVLSALMKVYAISCHDRGHINIMLVLQSCTDPLHILPSPCSETNATSDGVYNFSNIEVKEDVDVIEEIFISVNEEVVPGDKAFPDTRSEPAEVSYVCICLVLDTFYLCPGILKTVPIPSACTVQFT